MVDLKPFFAAEGKSVITQARRNLSNNKRDKRGFRRINTTRRLSDSMRVETYKFKMVFKMEDYGMKVDAGMQGTSGKIQSNWQLSVFPRERMTRAPAFTKIKSWAAAKPVPFGKTDASAKSLANKIKYQGLQPKLFFSDAWNNRENKFREGLANHINEAIDDSIPEQTV